MKMFHKDYHWQVYGSPFDCHLKSSDTIQVKVLNNPDGWTVDTSDFRVINGEDTIIFMEGYIQFLKQWMFTLTLKQWTRHLSIFPGIKNYSLYMYKNNNDIQ